MDFLTLNMNESSNEAGLSIGLNLGAFPPITWKRTNTIRTPQEATNICRYRKGLNERCSKITCLKETKTG